MSSFRLDGEELAASTCAKHVKYRRSGRVPARPRKLCITRIRRCRILIRAAARPLPTAITLLDRSGSPGGSWDAGERVEPRCPLQRRRKLHIACDDFFYFVVSRLFRCHSLPCVKGGGTAAAVTEGLPASQQRLLRTTRRCPYTRGLFKTQKSTPCRWQGVRVLIGRLSA